MTNHSQMKLGKLPAIRDARTLKLAKYLSPAAAGSIVSLPDGLHESPGINWPPDSCDWTVACKQPFGMMLNDQLSDCTIAACGHAVQIWTANRGEERTLPDSLVERFYSLWDGYVPGEPSTDRGGFELDVLSKWRKDSLYGSLLDAYAEVNVSSLLECQRAIDLFGGIYVGLQLPVSAQTQDVWDVTPSDSGLWGGHAVFVPAYAYNGAQLKCITWGEKKRMTWPFLQKYCDEAYALMSSLWLDKEGLAASGFNYAALDQDLGELAQLQNT